MAKAGLALFVAVCVAVLAYRLYLASLSDETRIRKMLEAVADGFNDASASRISDRLTADFSVERGGLGRREVHAFLVQFFFQERDHKSGKPLWRVELRPEDIDLRIEEGEQDGPHTAHVEVTARFVRLSGPDSQPAGGTPATAVFSGVLKKKEGSWLIDSASHRLLEGRWPF
jgi:hypothetical protein